MDIRDLIIDVQKDFVETHEMVHMINTCDTHAENNSTDIHGFIRTVGKDFPSHCMQ